jgi:uncharacterized protein YpuA (DUF1002 family)
MSKKVSNEIEKLVSELRELVNKIVEDRNTYKQAFDKLMNTIMQNTGQQKRDYTTYIKLLDKVLRAYNIKYGFDYTPVDSTNLKEEDKPKVFDNLVRLLREYTSDDFTYKSFLYGALMKDEAYIDELIRRLR